VFLELILLLRTSCRWSARLVVRVTCVGPFPSLVGTGEAMFLELVRRAAMIVVFHVLSPAACAANRPLPHHRCCCKSVAASRLHVRRVCRCRACTPVLGSLLLLVC